MTLTVRDSKTGFLEQKIPWAKEKKTFATLELSLVCDNGFTVR